VENTTLYLVSVLGLSVIAWKLLFVWKIVRGLSWVLKGFKRSVLGVVCVDCWVVFE